MIDDNKIIQQLNKLIEKGAKIETQELEYDSWRDSAISLLATIFGDKHFQVTKFAETSAVNSYVFWDSTRSQILSHEVKKYEDSKNYINNLIEQIETFGTTTVKGVSDSKSVSKGHVFNISQQQSQNQHQTISFEIFVDVIKSELDEEQQKVLKQVLEEFQKTNNFTKVIKYFKTLGDNVLANLIATVILNPSIITQLANQLSK